MADRDFLEIEDDGLEDNDIENNDVENSDLEVIKDSTQDVEGLDSDDDYEEICFSCRRPEGKVGKMFHISDGITICNDCMHNALNTINSMPMSMEEINEVIAKIPQEDGEAEVEKATKSDIEQVFNEIKDKFPGISFLNISDMGPMSGIPQKQKLKKKKKDGEAKPILDIKDIQPPHVVKAKLDDYVIGQEYAKKVISVAVYNHYKRVATGMMDEIEIEKSNMLMIGPTGCGKTYLVKMLAKLLNVPLAITDATSLTEAGYIGDDIESVVSKLLAAADNDVERAESGIIFIDEIDKIAKKQNTNSRDVSGESVQQGMLKLLEGAEIEVPVGANSKNAMVPLTTINTKNILFICGGAFPDLADIIKQRLNKQTSIGYQADLKDKYDKEKNLLTKVEEGDLKKYGMIPEFIGRLPIIYSLEALDKDMLVKILREPKNAILKQYQKLLELDEVKLEFSEDALEAIAQKALKKDTGARALRAIIEKFMLDIMYEIPKDSNIGKVTITGDYINGVGGPIIEIRQDSPSVD